MLFSRSQIPIEMETYRFQANSVLVQILTLTHDLCYTVLYEFMAITTV